MGGRRVNIGDVYLVLQMSEWIANNREVFLVTYTQIGSSHQQAGDLQSEHNQFAMSAMVRSVTHYIDNSSVLSVSHNSMLSSLPDV